MRKTLVGAAALVACVVGAAPAAAQNSANDYFFFYNYLAQQQRMQSMQREQRSAGNSITQLRRTQSTLVEGFQMMQDPSAKYMKPGKSSPQIQQAQPKLPGIYGGRGGRQYFQRYDYFNPPRGPGR